MKNIWVVAVLIVLSFVFVPKTNAKDIELLDIELPGESTGTQRNELKQLKLPEPETPSVFKKESFTKDGWKRTTETTPLVKHYKDGSVAKKKFSARIGMGNAYNLGVKINGKEFEDGIKLSNSSTLAIKLGYSLNKYVEVQGEYSRAGNFKNHDENEDAFGNKGEWNTQLILSAYTANLKLTIPIAITDKITFSPYIFGGLGRATYKEIYNEKEYYYGNKWRDDTEIAKFYGNCFKIGEGFDLNVYGNIFLFSEYNYQEIRFITNDKKITIHHSEILGGVGLKF
ncbi:MAG: outer membrane beta-barrel protein [Minisyncoccota bacterium]